jgi:hypothetical protein
MVTIEEDGVKRRVTAAQAFLVYMTKRALDGDGAAARATSALIEEARPASPADRHVHTMVIQFVAPGMVNGALESLRMASKLDRYRPSARMVLEPWVVEQALARLGEGSLSVEEQTKIVRVVRTPHKVRWPDWWKVRP